MRPLITKPWWRCRFSPEAARESVRCCRRVRWCINARFPVRMRRMKIHRMICSAVLVSLIGIAQALPAAAADIRVLCSNGFKAVFEELAPQFERASGHKVNVTFDLAVLTPALIDDLIKSGKLAADSRDVIARTGLGIMVRSGARKPDVRTT